MVELPCPRHADEALRDAKVTRCIATPAGYMVDGEHLDGCDNASCRGCWVCVPVIDGYPATHCTARSRCTNHIEDGVQSCPKCVAATRAIIRKIALLTPLLSAAAVETGRIDSEAFNLAGPAADPAGWSATKVQAIHDGTIDTLPEDDEAHPTAVLGRWELMIREDYGHEGTA
jgi:hypothetical protein